MGISLSFFLLLCFSESIYAVSALSPGGLALMSLLRHWTSVPSSIKLSWNASDSNPCSWVGVQCDYRKLNVVGLNLSSYEISGQLGSEFASLKQLKSVDFSNNNFSNSIPPELGSCGLLEHLDLSLNSLTGELPESFGSLRNLRFINLYSNYLTGAIPETLFSIPQLETIYLNVNKLSGTIPSNVGNMSKVVALWLYGNELSGTIPPSIGNCSKLEELYLTDNRLVGTLPESLNNLENLVYLDVSVNSLEGSIPLGLGSCIRMNTLDLSFNSFSGGIPPGLGNCSSLSQFAAVNCGLTGPIPSSFGQLSKLTALHLSENRLSGKIPPELGKCRSLSDMQLDENKLEGTIPREIGMLSELRNLFLFTNHLTGEIPLNIWKIQSLEILYVYNNNLSGEIPSEITELKHLRNISLYNNQFSGVIPQGFGINSSLIVVDFMNNSFTGRIPPNLCFRKQLQRLILGLNYLEGNIPSDVGSCSTLTRLILKQNNLTGILPKFVKNPNFSFMDLSENRISGEFPFSFQNLTNITSINLSANKLSGLIPTELGDLVDLQGLNLSHNDLEGPLPSQLSNCIGLLELDVSYNFLNGSIPSSLRSMSGLATLSLGENHFTGGIPPFLFQFKSLLDIQLSGNLLGGDIPSLSGSDGAVENLKTLNLSRNGLTGQLPAQLGKLVMLEQLDLSHNNLTGTLSALADIRSLVNLDVAYNFFSGPIPEALMNLLNSFPSSFLGNSGLCLSCLPTGGLNCTQNGNLRPCDLPPHNQRGLSKVEISLVALGSSIFLVLVLLGMGYMFLWYRRPEKEVEISAEEGASSLLNKIMEATENLNNKYIIGRGSHGTVYKASLGPDKVFAVKKLLFTGLRGGGTSMVREIETVGKVKHRNLCKLQEFWLRKDYVTFLWPLTENAFTTTPSKESDVYSYGVVLLELITRKTALDPSFSEEADIVGWAWSLWSKSEEIEMIVDPNLLDEFIDSSIMEQVTDVLLVALRCTEKEASRRPSMREVIRRLEDANATARKCSDTILFGQNSVLPRSLCWGRVFGRDSALTEFCSVVVTLLVQSVRTRFCSGRILFGHSHTVRAECSDRILFGRCHSARAECSDTILFGHNSVRPRSLCWGRVLGRDSALIEFCLAVVTLLGQSVRTGFCSGKILFGHDHTLSAECSDTILLGQDSVRPRSHCSGRVFGHDSAREGFCSAMVTLFRQNVQTRFCLGRIMFGHGHSVQAECSDTILLGKDSVRPRTLCSRRVFGHDSVRPLPWFPPRVSFSINVFERELRIFKYLYSSACDTSSSSLERVPTSGSEVGTSNPQLPLASTSHPFQPSTSQPLPPSSSQPSHSLSRKNALGDVKDQADDKAIPKPWYTADEKSGKMSIEDLQDLIREYPLPEGWYAHLPGLQEPANYGTKFETGIYEEQHYRMAPGQLIPNGWRKLADLIYLVQTSGYKPDATDFMRVFFEICFVKGVANCPGWYYIHSRQRLLKGGPKSNKGWHSRYFFVGSLDKGELPFDRDWNPFCKDFENPGKSTPNNLTKHILSHIKVRGGLYIDEPLSEEQLEWAKIIPPKPIPTGLLIPSPPSAIPSMSSAEIVPVVFIPVLISTLIAEMASGSGKSPKGGFLGVLQKAKGKRKEKQPSAELPPVPKRTRVTPPERSPRILEQVSIDDDPIFRPRWTLRCDDLGMPDSHVSEQHLLHGILPQDKEVFQTQTHKTFACSFAQAVYTEAQEASHRAEELSKQEADHLAQIATLEKRLERVKRKAAEEVTKARDQGIRDFLDGNAGDKWLKKRADDGLEIYELGFAKAKEMFAERFPDILLDGFVLPAVISPSGETVLPSEAGDAAASHPLREGPSGDAPEP
ncbi:hypothetical protein RJ639_002930 [Escallonia herrerae]|uniref:non-specific serine/threonine protein kinase n=1 Tax=Escallonia herrerae TaxID=1293975 RepID=A0AA88W0C1_9ASTE|nr:hypothetical protein RJ639_002930 [Escallonia herrerae]